MAERSDSESGRTLSQAQGKGKNSSGSSQSPKEKSHVSKDSRQKETHSATGNSVRAPSGKTKKKESEKTTPKPSRGPRGSAMLDSEQNESTVSADNIETMLTNVMTNFENKFAARMAKLEGAVSYIQSEAFGYDDEAEEDEEEAETGESQNDWYDPSNTDETMASQSSDLSDGEDDQTKAPPQKKARLSPGKTDDSAQSSSATKPSKLLDRVNQKYGIKEGQELDDEICDVVKTTLTKALSEEEMTALTSKYDTPKNCELLTKVKVNQLIWDKLEPTVRTNDLKLQKIQGSMMKGVTAMNRVMEKVLIHQRKFKCSDEEERSLDDVLDTAIDALSLACIANMDLNTRRRDLIKGDLSEDYKGLCATSVPVTTELFGDEVTKQVKELAEVSKVGKNLANRSKNSVSRGRSLWRGRSRGAFIPRGRGRGTSYYANYGGHCLGYQNASRGRWGFNKRGSYRGRGSGSSKNTQKQE